MATYQIPEPTKSTKTASNEAILVASGDLRASANQMCWPAQDDMEKRVIAAFAQEGITVKRGHSYDDALKHDFIWNQRMGMDRFKKTDQHAKLIVPEAVCQYSHHLLTGATRRHGTTPTAPE